MITIDVEKAKKTGTKSDLALFISFPYDAKVVNVMRDMPQRYWHNEEKQWEVPFTKLNAILKALETYEIEIKADDASIFQSKKVAPIAYNFKTQPFQHQIDGYNYGMEHDRWLLGDEQGLGKTKQVIDIAVAKKAQRNYKHCLIICGVNGLKWNWVEEIHTHSNEGAWILGQSTKNGKTVIGSNADKKAQIKSLFTGELADKYFLITNIESLRDEEIANNLSKLCDLGIIGMIAADEIHKAKNSKSQQGKGFLKLQADTMIAMTGTPLMNTPLDLYIIMKWLGYENHSFYAFKNYYCEMGGYGNYQVVGYKHLDSLQEQVKDFMLRRLKADVLDLPEKTYINDYVEMTAKQAQIYKEVHSSLVANIDKVKKAVNPLSEMIRLRQATGYTGILSSTVKESAKITRLMEIVEDAVQNGKKTVVFSNWTQMTDVIYETLKQNGIAVAQITGATPDEDRQSIVNTFQNTNGIQVLIGTIGAMGTGLTLTAGTVEVFMDEPWNMALKEQAVDRCHRIGQKSNITVYTLLTKNTIDERIHEIVSEKGELADKLIDGKIAIGADKGQIVDYLLS